MTEKTKIYRWVNGGNTEREMWKERSDALEIELNYIKGGNGDNR